MKDPKKPLNLEVLMATLHGADVNMTQALNAPVAIRISELQKAVDDLRTSPTISAKQIEDLDATVKGLSAIHTTVAKVQEQLEEAKPAPAPPPPPLPQVPASSDKKWYESKKFLAFIGTIAAEVFLPMLASFGMPPNQVELMQKFIGLASAFLIGGQSVVDAVAAHHDPPGPEQ